MYVKYGDYTHQAGSPAVTIERENVHTEAGSLWLTRERWTIQGMIANPSGVAADMSTAIAALENAYRSGGQDLKLLMPDGSTSSEHVLLNANCLGGTRVTKPPSYPKGDGPEYVTLRHFTVTVEGDIPATSRTDLLSWVETISFSGGGPRYGYVETLVGLPQKQKLRQATIYKAVQSGRAVGIANYPTIPQPMWAADQVDARDVQYDSPRRRGFSSGSDTWTEWGVSWTYRFESAYPMIAPNGPNRWRQ